MATIGRRAYAEMFGPTTGDRVRLADTGLRIKVEVMTNLKTREGLAEVVAFVERKVLLLA